MLYLENYQYNLIVVFPFDTLEEALFELENIMEIYLFNGILFVYEILVGQNEVELIFHLKGNGL